MEAIRKEVITRDIFLLHNVLTQKECDNLILYSEQKGYEEATVFTGSSHQLMKGVRNNLRVIIDDQSFADKIWNKVSYLFKERISGFKAYGLNERFRFYKYSAGQRFKMHKDGAFVRGAGDTSIYTFIIYLNENYEGGSTDFYDGYSIKPKTGSALVFLHPLRHEGTVIKAGVKYAIRSDVMYINEEIKNTTL